MKYSIDDIDVTTSERYGLEGDISLQSLGAIIREEREAKELTVDYMADKTKIRQAYLESIELGTMEGFHGNVYKRGFVKCYLESLDMMDLWPYYDGILKDSAPKVDTASSATPPLGDFTPPTKGFRKGSRKTIFVLLLAVIAASGWYIWSNKDVLKGEVERIQEEQLEIAQKVKEQKAKEEEERLAAEAAAAEALRLAASEDQDVAMAVPQLADLPVSGDNGKPVLVIAAAKDSWIRITKEGERIFGGTLKAGQEAKVEADGRIHVIYGRPETLKVHWNGSQIDPSTEGPGPVHFLYTSKGDYSAISPQDAEALWAQAPLPEEAIEEPPVEEEKAGPSMMVIKAVKGDCWLKATSGNKTHYAGTLKRGNEASMELSEPIHVVFGNPSAISVTVDGKEVGYAGTPGQVARTIYGIDGSVKAAPR